MKDSKKFFLVSLLLSCVISALISAFFAYRYAINDHSGPYGHVPYFFNWEVFIELFASIAAFLCLCANKEHVVNFLKHVWKHESISIQKQVCSAPQTKSKWLSLNRGVKIAQKTDAKNLRITEDNFMCMFGTSAIISGIFFLFIAIAGNIKHVPSTKNVMDSGFGIIILSLLAACFLCMGLTIAMHIVFFLYKLFVVTCEYLSKKVKIPCTTSCQG